MTSRMTTAQYRQHVAQSSVSASGRVVPVSTTIRKNQNVVDTPRPNKYGAKKVEIDGIVFDSKHEAQCWNVLKLRVAAGLISELQRQVKFELHVADTKVCTYVADFTYLEHGALVVADAKGVKTPLYRLKKKMLKAEYGYDIVEM